MAYRYWKLLATQKYTTYYEFDEIEMAETIGGADVCNGGTASKGSAMSGTLANVFDNNLNNQGCFGSATLPNANAWVMYDFGAGNEKNIAEIRVYSLGWPEQMAKGFEVYGSNDSVNFTLIAAFTNLSSWSSYSWCSFTLNVYSLSGSITESLAITDWRVTAVCMKNGTAYNSVATSGNTYSIGLPILTPVMLTLSPKIDGAWKAGTAIALNYYVVAVNPDATPHLWKCTTAGTTGGSEPSWNLSGTTSDGSVTWTYIAPLVDPVTIGPKIPAPNQ